MSETKNNKETIFNIFAILLANTGLRWFTNIPKIKGTANKRDTNFTISNGEIATSFKIVAVGPYIEPQNCRFIGVIKTANKVAMAVRLTDNAELPLARCVMKFEIFPPGHAATINIPKAMLGIGFINHTKKKVIIGSRIN